MAAVTVGLMVVVMVAVMVGLMAAAFVVDVLIGP